jgi:hypothetical protein
MEPSPSEEAASCLWVSKYFTEPEMLLPYSKVISTGTYPEPDKSGQYHSLCL